MRGVIVAGIGTEVGKTLVAVALCERLHAMYWKPVASGSEDGPTDDLLAKRLLRGGDERVLPTTYSFTKSLSPHVAARLDGQAIELANLRLPLSSTPIVVELAGGVAVPLNDRETNLDLIQKLALPVVVVSRHYLGSINHSLLTIEALRMRGVAIAGIIFNGDELPDTERIILQLAGVRCLGRVPNLKQVDSDALVEVSDGIAFPYDEA
jgi:dethiobiotin synthetase